MGKTYVPFPTPLLCNTWSYPLPLSGNDPPPAGAAVHTNIPCATRAPTTQESLRYAEFAGVSPELIIGLAPNPPPNAQLFPGTFDLIHQVGPENTQMTLFEIPPGSKQFWCCLHSVVVARGYINCHKNCFCVKGWVAQSTERY